MIRQLRWPSVPIPDKIYIRMKYVQTLDITQTGGGASPNTYLFRGNSVFDPNQSGIGGQAQRYDQMSAMFRKYKVRWSRIVVRFINNSASEFADVGVVPLRNQSALASHWEYAEQPYARVSLLGTRNGGHEVKWLKNFVTTKKLCGNTLTDEEFSGSAGNPTTVWSWHIWSQNTDRLVNTNIAIEVTVTYGTEWYDRKEAALS